MSEYLVTVTAVKRRDRGRKTVELKTFEYDKTNRRWIYHPGRLTKKLDGTGADVDDVISAILSRDHGRLTSGRTAWPLSKGFNVPVAARAPGEGPDQFEQPRRHAPAVGLVGRRGGGLTAHPSGLTERPFT